MSFRLERPSRVDLLGLVLFLKSVPHILLLVPPQVTGKCLLRAYQAKVSENAVDLIVVCICCNIFLLFFCDVFI